MLPEYNFRGDNFCENKHVASLLGDTGRPELTHSQKSEVGDI